jgi:hypothetical protein
MSPLMGRKQGDSLGTDTLRMILAGEKKLRFND